ncbi:aldo/keto reductase [Agromyces intestinalis]|uniref:Aldo/keto reductase n=1 Tax=Agromyces intestinalis TaxID=2592652 RepID=A0A5C1YFL8_9MICO|nr:aldo/keto reductase [Agromyces intestinalis]QEO14843.1 aldo/keto reductase [Agromyces intestinalis]
MSVGYRHVGASGLVVADLAIGTAAFGKAGRIRDGQAGVDRIVGRALDLGASFFDTADGYGDEPGVSELLLGRALAGRRDEAVISTKFGSDLRGALGPDWGARGSRRYIRRAVEASLTRLGTDWIDLYQLHSPDPSTPLEETLSTLDDLVREGKIRYAGVSNLPAWRLVDAHHTARERGLHPFVSVQHEYSLLWRGPERDILPAVRRLEVGFLAYFPLQNGLLTGKYRRGAAPADGKVTRFKPHLLHDAPWQALERFREFAAVRGVTPVHLAYGWLLADSAVSSLITGVTSVAQLEANVDAASWRPTEAERDELRDLFDGRLSGKPGRHETAAPRLTEREARASGAASA